MYVVTQSSCLHSLSLLSLLAHMDFISSATAADKKRDAGAGAVKLEHPVASNQAHFRNEAGWRMDRGCEELSTDF